jgi:hypothetical protein
MSSAAKGPVCVVSWTGVLLLGPVGILCVFMMALHQHCSGAAVHGNVCKLWRFVTEQLDQSHTRLARVRSQGSR